MRAGSVATSASTHSESGITTNEIALRRTVLMLDNSDRHPFFYNGLKIVNNAENYYTVQRKIYVSKLNICRITIFKIPSIREALAAMSYQ